MKKSTTIITITIVCLLFESCNVSKKENVDEQYNEQYNAKTVSAKTRADTVNPFEQIAKWDITLTEVTTILKDVSAEEAEKINNSNPEDYGYDDYWAGQDEETGQWEAHITTMAEVGRGTVSDSEIVHRLNEMMLDPQYADYREDVKINGTTANATWYAGNRGGGICEDFPKSLAEYICKKCNY